MLALELSGVHVGQNIRYLKGKNKTPVEVFGVLGIKQGAEWSGDNTYLYGIGKSQRIRLIGYKTSAGAKRGNYSVYGQDRLTYHTLKYDQEIEFFD